jgi:hypothetical protein
MGECQLDLVQGERRLEFFLGQTMGDSLYLERCWVEIARRRLKELTTKHICDGTSRGYFRC